MTPIDPNMSRTWHRSVLGAAVLGMGVLLTGTSAGTGSVDKTPFGNTQDGKAVDLYTLTNDRGASVKFIAYGGIITAINVPDRWGKLDNVVLGFKELADYESLNPYFGALIGRYANRRPVRGMNCDEFGDNVAVLMAGGPLMAARYRRSCF